MNDALREAMRTQRFDQDLDLYGPVPAIQAVFSRWRLDRSPPPASELDACRGFAAEYGDSSLLVVLAWRYVLAVQSDGHVAYYQLLRTEAVAQHELLVELLGRDAFGQSVEGKTLLELLRQASPHEDPSVFPALDARVRETSVQDAFDHYAWELIGSENKERIEKMQASFKAQAAEARKKADKAPTIRIPVHLIELLNQLKDAISLLTERLGRAPTEEELAAHLELPVDRLRHLQEVAGS